jgi:CheY-like chemotaxis protein
VVLATRVTPDEVEAVGDGHALKIEEESLRLLHLDELLGQPAGALPPVMDVLVVGDGSQRVALRVGRLIGEQQLIRQGLDAFLSGIPLLNGTAVLEGGRHAYFLNQAALFRGTTEKRRAQPAFARAERRRRVLIADDSEITRDMLVAALRRLDCDVVEAVDGQDALERLEQGRVDLVLTDLDMPVLDGFGLIRALRARPDTSDLPVIVLSTRGSASDKTLAMAAGANAYIVKARFRQSDLQELLRQHLPGAL